MRFNSQIKLKGDKEPIFVSSASATQIQKMFEDKSLSGDSPIRVGRWSFLKNAIRAIVVCPDQLDGDDLKVVQNNEEEDFQKRKTFLTYTPEGKSEHLEPFKLFYRAMVGKDADDEVLSKAKEIQLNFFRSNHKRCYCDPLLFKALIGIPRKMMNIWENGGIRVYEMAIMHDMKMSEIK